MTDDARFESLVTDLNDPQRRDEAVQSLGALRDPRAIDPLINILRETRDDHAMAYRTRQSAAESLGAIGDLQALTALIYALEDPHSAVKISAAYALGKLNDSQAVEPLLNLLQNRSTDVRAAVLEVLGQLAGTHDVPIAPIVQRTADFDDSVRDIAERVLRELGSKAFDALLPALHDPNSTIRGAAATLLGELKDERAFEALRKVSWDDDSKWVRTRAEWALSQLPKAAFPYSHGDAAPRAPDSPRSALEIIRENSPRSYPSLRPQPKSADPDPQNLTAEQIEVLLDKLDLRLVNGEITEATYKQLAQRWETRLKELRDE